MMRMRGLKILPGGEGDRAAQRRGGGVGEAYANQAVGVGGAGEASAKIGPLARAAEALRIILGAGSYAAYRDHMVTRHPEREPMTEAQFFRDRQQARYGGGQGRCC